MGALSPEVKALLSQPLYAWATTVRPDGSLHNTVVWVDVDGEELLFNTAVGRAKEKHLRNDPRVSISVLSTDNAYHFVSVSGTAKLDVEGADEVIDRLAKKYLNADTYPFRRPGEQRINVRITPEQVVYSAPR